MDIVSPRKKMSMFVWNCTYLDHSLLKLNLFNYCAMHAFNETTHTHIMYV